MKLLEKKTKEIVLSVDTPLIEMCCHCGICDADFYKYGTKIVDAAVKELEPMIKELVDALENIEGSTMSMFLNSDQLITYLKLTAYNALEKYKQTMEKK